MPTPDAGPWEDETMHLDLTDAETLALLNLLIETIEADRYPMSPRLRYITDREVFLCSK